MTKDNPRFEYARAVIPAPDDTPREGDEEECALLVAARMARELVRHVERACEGDGETCLMILRRAMGMTLDEIGCLAGVSHIAVRKRLRRVARRFPEMAGYLSPGPLDESAREELEERGIFRTDDGHKRKTLRQKSMGARHDDTTE